MKVISEMSVADFAAWGGAEDTVSRIVEFEKSYLFDDIIKELYPLGIDEVDLNDLLRYSSDWIYEMLDIPLDD